MLAPLERQQLRDRLTKAVQQSATEKRQDKVSFLNFKQDIWRKYEHTRHHELIDSYLLEVKKYIQTGGQEGIGRLMISIPPRHGKTAVLRHFQAWLLGEMPDKRIINTSYSIFLAQSNSKAIRNIIASSKYGDYYPRTKLAKDTKAASMWDTTEGGGMIAAGVGGSITGYGANLIVIDDPVKGRAEAESDLKRQRLKDWYTNDVITRLEEPGGAIIIIQTRWHQDDLSGWLLSQQASDDSEVDDPERWTVLSLPALAEEDDPLGREPGEALWETKYSKQWLNRRRQTMGEYAFASIYQQKPIPSGGGLFDTALIELIEAEQVPTLAHVCRFYDLAVTANKTSDFTVGFKLGVTDDQRYYILDVWRVRREFPEVKIGIKQNAGLDGTAVSIRLEAEKAGLVALQELLRDPDLSPYTIDAKPPLGDKYSRATPFASRVNAKRVWMVKGRWNRDTLDEFAIFNKGKHDDIVDAASGAYDLLSERFRNSGDLVPLNEIFGDAFQ